MIKILANDGIDKNAKQILISLGYKVDTNHYENNDLIEKLKEVNVVVIRSATKLTKEIFKNIQGGNLKLAIRAGVGIDNIDIHEGEKIGITITNTPKASSDSVAELALGHMFSIARNIGISNITMRKGKWEKKNYKGIELSGKILGLIGFGRIARSLAKKAKLLGMNILYTDLLGESKTYDNYSFCSKEYLLRKSDFISLHIPYDKNIGPIIKEKEFSIMKDGAYLINCARGGVVNEKDLLNALNKGKIAGAGIDVFEKEPTNNIDLINHPCVSVTPHIGASTNEAQKRIGIELIEIIKNFSF